MVILKPTDAAVMMWIHGGGYHLGAGSIPELLPAPLAAYNDVIVVTINYRLGPLGFLATGKRFTLRYKNSNYFSTSPPIKFLSSFIGMGRGFIALNL